MSRRDNEPCARFDCRQVCPPWRWIGRNGPPARFCSDECRKVTAKRQDFTNARKRAGAVGAGRST